MVWIMNGPIQGGGYQRSIKNGEFKVKTKICNLEWQKERTYGEDH